MLSAVLRSKIAIKISIQIIDAFVKMRKNIMQNTGMFQRLDKVERKQIETDKQIDYIFDAIESRDIKPKQGIFFDGQVFDAYVFVSGLVKRANKLIVLIYNYIDESVLTLFTKRKKGVCVIIFTKEISQQLRLDLGKYNSQYDSIEIKEFKMSHDRFLIIDRQDVYHIGASLKDLGKKWFAFSKIDKGVLSILNKLN